MAGADGLGRGTTAGARLGAGGAVVERRAGPWTPAVHAWLAHLRSVGVHAVAAPLGIQGADRGPRDTVERQARLPGRPGWHPPHPVVRTDAGIAALADWLTLAHAAAASFPTTTRTWAAGPRARAAGEVVAHGDLGLWNTLWDDDGLTGVVDHDLAEPAPPWWDVGNLAWAVVPLVPLGDDVPPRDGWAPDQRHRLDVLAGLLGRTRAELVEVTADWLALQVRRRTVAVPDGSLWRRLAARTDEAEALARQLAWLRAGGHGLAD